VADKRVQNHLDKPKIIATELIQKGNKTVHNNVYKPLLVAGLRGLSHLVTLVYLDNKALLQRNGSYTRTLGAMQKDATNDIGFAS